MIPSKPKNQTGFTLIELMIVIAIIGVLAAIALPIYQDYVLKAQITRVYYELSATRNAIDDIIMNGNTPTLDPSLDSTPNTTGGLYEYLQVNGNNPQSNMIYIAQLDPVSGAPFKSITANFGRDAYRGIHDLKIMLTRTPNGWQCTFQTAGVAGWKDKFLPANCKTE